MINGLQNRNIVGSAYNAHFAAGLGASVGLVLSKSLNSWAITASRTTVTEGGGIHFSATPLPANGTFTPADLMTIFMFAKFRWDFGDAGAGTWASDGTSRNAEYGPEAAHVFNSVGTGTYTVTLYITAGGSETSVATQAITVNAANTVYSGANTICFSNTTDFTGAPAGSTQITTSSFSTAWTNLATGKRLMFKGGDTFTSTTFVNKGTTAAIDDIMLDSFGTGLANIVSNQSSGAVCDFGYLSSVVCHNHIYRRLKFTAPQSTTISYVGIAYHNYNEHLTISDCEFYGFNFPIGYSAPELELQTNITQSRFGVCIHGNILDNYTTPCLYNPAGNYLIYGAGIMTSLVGNILKNGDATVNGDSHMVRYAEAKHFAVRHNYFQYGSHNSRHCLKIHNSYFKGNNLDGTPRWFTKVEAPYNQPYLTTKWFSWMYSEFISVGQNICKTVVNGQDWPFIFGPTDILSQEEVRGIVCSNNYFSGVYGQQAITVEGSTIAIRNNVINGTQWPSCAITNINTDNDVIGYSNHFIYKNTLYKKNAVDGNATTATIHSGSSIYPENVQFNNNLVYALPKDTGGKPTAGLYPALTPINFNYSEAGNSYDPVTYPFTGTNPPGDSMAQFTLVTPGTGADVGDY